MIPLERWDLERLARDWSRARPFPHLILDGLLEASDYAALKAAAAAEPLWLLSDEIYQHSGSADPPRAPLLRAFQDALGAAPLRDALRAITGVVSRAVSLRVYRYDEGDYLLPHTDWRPGEERVLAFAYYLGDCGADFSGGELSLYDCTLVDGEISRAREARLIKPRENRFALFTASGRALHRVREVSRGSRLSLAGWFLA